MSNSYIPSRDGDLDTWLTQFKTLIAASPTSYGLVSSDATAITSAYNAWHTAYLAATNETTRSKLTVMAKNEQRAIVLGLVRGYAATIRANKAVSNELKAGIGLHVPDTQPSPVPVPTTQPLLTVTGISQGLQQLNAADQLTPAKKAKPAGATGLLIFRTVAETAVSEPTDAEFVSFVTRAAFQSQFAPADNGKTATYFGRWTNGKGEMGPWSPPASMRIAA